MINPSPIPSLLRALARGYLNHLFEIRVSYEDSSVFKVTEKTENTKSLSLPILHY